jgi:biopolymer transport protein ExbD
MRRPVPAYAAAVQRGEPIAELNITPLIDVMLVLLIMFIITIPAMTHKVSVDLPQPGPIAAERVEHRLVLARRGAATLDGVALDDAALAARLRAVAAEPGAALLMRTDPEMRYERFDQVLAQVKRAGVTRLGFEGHEAMVR